MNNKKRKQLNIANSYLQNARDVIDEVLFDEQDCLDNMSGSFEGTERYENLSNAVDNMEDAISSIDDAITYIDEASS